MKLAIITINYNGSESTVKLLRSLAEQTSKDFEVIVIDNASEETDFNNLKNHCATLGVAQVKLIRNGQNLGFSGGNNVGIKKALEMEAEWVLLLNNDTWVEPGFIASIKAILAQKQGIVGVPLDEGEHTAYAGKVQWLKPTLRHVYSIKYLVSSMDTKYKIQNTKYYVIGGGMLIHKNVFEKIGLLNEKYFLYFEDADFCVRARKANIPISIADNVMIHHNVSATTKKLGAPLLLRYHYRNALYFNLKNGSWYIKLLVWPWSWVVLLKQAIKIMMNHKKEQSLAILSGVLDFYKNRMGRIK